MLDQTYYNGEREKEFERMKVRYRNLLQQDTHFLSNDDYLIRENLYIEKVIFDRLQNIDSKLLIYLLPWTLNSRMIRTRDRLAFSFPLNEGQEYEGTRTYELSQKIMGNFWFHNLFTEEADYESFQNLEEMGGCDFDFELPPSRCLIQDGQMKIVIDAVLAVDSMDKKNDIKIDVSGSAGDSGYLCGMAYEVIGSMVTNSVISLYDPNTINCEYVDENNNRYIHYSAKYDYENVQCDLLLDDVWRDTEKHEDFDPKGNAYKVRDYSIKHFFWDRNYRGNIYEQCFFTNNRESRCVSRKPCVKYKIINELGSCAACVELKYNLKNIYSKRTYDMIMQSHKINCKTRKKRGNDVFTDTLLEFKEIMPNQDLYKKAFYLPWDYGGVQEKAIPYNFSLIRENYILISHERYLTSYVSLNCRGVLKIENNKWYFSGQKFKGVVYKQPDFVVRTGRFINYHEHMRDQVRKNVPIDIDLLEKRNLIVKIADNYHAEKKSELKDLEFLCCRLEQEFKNGGYVGECYVNVDTVVIDIMGTDLRYFDNYISSDNSIVVVFKHNKSKLKEKYLRAFSFTKRKNKFKVRDKRHVRKLV